MFCKCVNHFKTFLMFTLNYVVSFVPLPFSKGDMLNTYIDLEYIKTNGTVC